MSTRSRSVVLGGAGFLGSHITRVLLERGEAVRVFDRPNADLRNLEGLPNDWEFRGGDFLNEDDLVGAVEGAETLYHLISTTIPATSNRNPAYDIESNLVSTVNLLEAAVQAGVRRVLFVSSGGTVYGRPERVPVREDHPTRPECSYGVVKLAVENYLRLYRHLHGLSYSVVRLANPYGPHQDPAGAQGAASVFLGRAREGKPIEIWGDGSVVRDYVYVEDAVAGIVAAAHHGSQDGVYNVGSGAGVSLNELVVAIERASGRDLEVRYQPGRPFDVPVNILDIGKAERELGWSPRISLDDGLAATWRWLEARED